MIKVNQLKLHIDHTEQDLINAVLRKLKIKDSDEFKYKIIRKSIDARNKNAIKYVYTLNVYFSSIKTEEKILKKVNNNDIMSTNEIEYILPEMGEKQMHHRPIIIGSGPAGLFCTLMLARSGYEPVLIEQGEAVEDRINSVNEFWKKGILNEYSNVQYGEGGAGTFSDGKLNTQIKDSRGFIKKVLEIFVEYGANEEILYLNKPHIGTDVLCDIVKRIRQDIIKEGGMVLFNTRFINYETSNEKITSIKTVNTKTNEEKEFLCDVLVLAVGHSSRDTFRLLNSKNVKMESKPFAVGVRVEHLQERIGEHQYGSQYKNLPAADYKLTAKTSIGRGVYSFCMCPGGYVVNASSKKGQLAVNGMSYSKRDGKNANSAIIVTVNPDDFKSCDALGGIEFQEILEKKAFDLENGLVPVQLFKDFKLNVPTKSAGKIEPCIKGRYAYSNIRKIFPDFISESLIEGIESFGRNIKGYNDDDAVLSAVESRTSSPVRIIRNEFFESSVEGIYPCGEGAGYAGGITSAAIDGVKVFEKIFEKYAIKK